MIWIYNYPNWLIGLVLVSLMVGIALGGHRLFRKLVPWEATEESNALALGMLGIVAMMLSLLLAFSSVSVWEAYSSAEAAAVNEASVSGELVRDLAVYGGPKAAAAREAVRDYLQTVVDKEWPAMAKGGHSEEASHKFNAIFRVAALIEPRTAREEIMLGEIWSKANELNLHRRGRLNCAGVSAVPGALWWTLLIGIMINFTLFYLLPVKSFNDLLQGLYAGMLGLTLFFIVVMDQPFSGAVSVSPDPAKEALVSMRRWDAETAALPGASAAPKSGVRAESRN
jgi:hypothetical protein